MLEEARRITMIWCWRERWYCFCKERLTWIGNIWGTPILVDEICKYKKLIKVVGHEVTNPLWCLSQSPWKQP